MNSSKKKFTMGFVIIVFILTIFSTSYFAGIYGTSSEDQDAVITIPDLDVIDEAPVIEEPQFITASIVATGDIMFHSTQIKAAYDSTTKTYDFKPPFEKIKKHFVEADLALGNLETVTAGPEHGYRGYPTFNSPIEIIEAIKDAGFDILSTANNHSLDKGKEGIIETLDNISAYDMQSVGTYKEPTSDILIQDVNGINVAILSYTYGCNGLESLLKPEELEYMVNRIDEEKIKADIEKADELGVDATLVFIHWGNEYQREPSQYQTGLANKIIQWGGDIILGSHPHVIQRSEIINHNGEDKFVIYSMGNFISNQRRETLTVSNKKYTEDGVIVKLVLEKDVNEGKTIIKEVGYVPTWVNRYQVGGNLKYEILPTDEYIGNEVEGLTQEVMSRITESYNDTINIMDQK